MAFGIPELIILLVVGVFLLVSVAACVWAIVALLRFRTAQDDLRQRLDAVERTLRQSSTA